MDSLYCHEDNLSLSHDGRGGREPSSFNSGVDDDHDIAELFSSLLAKEHRVDQQCAHDAEYLSERREQAEWVACAALRHAFSVPTALLAIEYLDRGFGAGGVLRLPSAAVGGKPWMARLAAVACLSLASKVEESTRVSLLDLQLGALDGDGDSGTAGAYLFEPKTIRRMELLVLSALNWRMNPVAPLSFISPLLPLLCDKIGETSPTMLLRRCEPVLLAAILDRRWFQYPASVWAAATLRYSVCWVAENAEECQEFMHLFKSSKEMVEECLQVIMEVVGQDGLGSKRMVVDEGTMASHADADVFLSPWSPSGVIGSCFSCENSFSSEAFDDDGAPSPTESSVSSSPELRPPKRPRCQSQDDITRGF